ncbi:MAG: hypothetical protein HQK91_13320 [Nitrospirae bacterium]|nr:hypothetical protein [Nitrospirota bacterium]
MAISSVSNQSSIVGKTELNQVTKAKAELKYASANSKGAPISNTQNKEKVTVSQQGRNKLLNNKA